MIAEPEIYNGRDVSYGGREGPYDGKNIGSGGRQVIIPGPGVYRGQDGLSGGYARPYDGRNGPNGGHYPPYLPDGPYVDWNELCRRRNGPDAERYPPLGRDGSYRGPSRDRDEHHEGNSDGFHPWRQDLSCWLYIEGHPHCAREGLVACETPGAVCFNSTLVYNGGIIYFGGCQPGGFIKKKVELEINIEALHENN